MDRLCFLKRLMGIPLVAIVPLQRKQLEWTTEKPTVSGMYLRKNPVVQSVFIHHVINYKGILINPPKDGFQWFGPIEVPK